MLLKTRIRWKIIASSFAIMLGSVFLISLFVILTMKGDSESEILEYRQEATLKVKANLKNYVDVAFETIASNYKTAQDPEYLQTRYGQRLKNIVQVAVTTIDTLKTSVEAGEITLEEAKLKAAEYIRGIRYDGQKGYLWINDTGKPFPKMVMHPTSPQLEGQILDDPKYDCALGKDENLFKAFVDVTETSSEGFVDYLWPKPTQNGLTQRQPKLSYVLRIPEWNWIIGTGIYVDDALMDMVEKIKTDIARMRYDEGTGYFWINDTGEPFPKMVMHPTVPDLNGQVLDDPKFDRTLGNKENIFIAFVNATREEGQGFVDYLWPKPTKGGLTAEQPKLSYVRLFEPLGWIIGTGVYLDDLEAYTTIKKAEVEGRIYALIWKIVVMVVAVSLVSFVILLLVARGISRPIEEGGEFASQISNGDLSVEIDTDYQDEAGNLLRSMNKMVESLRERAALAEKISQGDLSVQVSLASEKDTLGRSLQKMIAELKSKANLADEIASGDLTRELQQVSDVDLLGKALNKMVSNLNHVLQRIQTTADELTGGSAQINSSSQSLAEGTSEQAASLEEISSSMEELSSQATSNLKNAAAAKSEAEKSKQEAEKGVVQMTTTLSAMDDISQMSEKITRIVKTIDEIAFQTNVLAINAAVEAARAGEYGKGFAVVAEEVRNLAQRSAEASKETTGMIKQTIKTIGNGVSQAKETAELLDTIVISAEKVNQLVDQIAVASNEQSLGTAQITEALAQVNQVVQDNAAAAEESASTSAVVDHQSRALQELVASFSLRANNAKPVFENKAGLPGQPAQAALMFEEPQEEPVSLNDLRNHNPELGFDRF